MDNFIDLCNFISEKRKDNCSIYRANDDTFVVTRNDNKMKAKCFLDETGNFQMKIETDFADILDIGQDIEDMRKTCDALRVIIKMKAEHCEALLKILKDLDKLHYCLNFEDGCVYVWKPSKNGIVINRDDDEEVYHSGPTPNALSFDVDVNPDEFENTAERIRMYYDSKMTEMIFKGTYLHDIPEDKIEDAFNEYKEFVNSIISIVETHLGKGNDTCSEIVVKFEDGAEHMFYLPLWDTVMGLIGSSCRIIKDNNQVPHLKFVDYEDGTSEIEIVFDENCEFVIKNFYILNHMNKGYMRIMNNADIEMRYVGISLLKPIILTVSVFNDLFSRTIEDQKKLYKILNEFVKKSYVCLPDVYGCSSDLSFIPYDESKKDIKFTFSFDLKLSLYEIYDLVKNQKVREYLENGKQEILNIFEKFM